MVGMVLPRGSGHRNPPIAAVPVGIGERSRAARLWPQDPRQGDSPGERRRPSLALCPGPRSLRNYGAAVTSDSVSYQQLLGIFACLALALVAHLESLPVWVLAAVGVSGGLRLGRRRDRAPR